MKKVAIVYWSGTGNTEAMALQVQAGAVATGCEVTLAAAADFAAAKAAEFDAFALGCPSMGSEVLEESEFEPMYEQLKPALAGKTVGLFGSYGWGDGEWMRNWQQDCTGAGAVMAVEPVIANETPDEDACAACKALGAAVGAV